MSTFEVLNKINVNGHTEKKNGLTYLSWAWAWAEVKKAFPDANYTVYENADGLIYHTDGRTAWVKTGVTIDGLEHIEYLPVMDYKNQSIPLERLTSTYVNKAVQRSLTKACARHGLGLYIYAGEDLPEVEQAEVKEEIEGVKAEKIPPIMVKAMLDRMARIGEKGINVEKVCESYGVKELADLTMEQYTDLNVKLNKEEERLRKAMNVG